MSAQYQGIQCRDGKPSTPPALTHRDAVQHVTRRYKCTSSMPCMQPNIPNVTLSEEHKLTEPSAVALRNDIRSRSVLLPVYTIRCHGILDYCRIETHLHLRGPIPIPTQVSSLRRRDTLPSSEIKRTIMANISPALTSTDTSSTSFLIPN